MIDPANKLDQVCDVLIENTKITKLAKNITDTADEVINASGKIVAPGIVDMHVHLREPGREDKETVASGTRAALRGGVTSVLTMPNTQPAIDSLKNVKLLKDIVKETACANVFIAAAITKQRLGKELSDIARLSKEGVPAFTDDGCSLDSDELLLKAFRSAKQNNTLLICHSEDKKLSSDGVVNLGIISTRMGLRGISNESEYKRVDRDIKLAAKASARVHIAHVSCKESVEIIAKAKAKRINVTAETAPHYFCLTEESVLGYRADSKVNPPLRSKQDVEALKKGLKEGTIDVIASDHAPHIESEKYIEFEHAEFGSTGLETELAAGITELIQPGILDWGQLITKMCINPARILGLDKGTLSVGGKADIIIVNSEKKWIVDKSCFVSKSKNCAFLGKQLQGFVEYTIHNGEVVYKK